MIEQTLQSTSTVLVQVMPSGGTPIWIVLAATFGGMIVTLASVVVGACLHYRSTARLQESRAMFEAGNEQARQAYQTSLLQYQHDYEEWKKNPELPEPQPPSPESPWFYVG